MPVRATGREHPPRRWPCTARPFAPPLRTSPSASTERATQRRAVAERACRTSRRRSKAAGSTSRRSWRASSARCTANVAAAAARQDEDARAERDRLDARPCDPDQPRDEPAVALQGERAVAHLPGRNRPGGLPDPDGPFLDRRQAVEPLVVSADLRRLGEGVEPVPPGPGNPLGTRWMGLSAPGVGIHGTNNPSSIGYSVSHGCIRMQVADSEWLFGHVDDRHDGVHRLMRLASLPQWRVAGRRQSLGCCSGVLIWDTAHSATGKIARDVDNRQDRRRAWPFTRPRVDTGGTLSLAVAPRQGRRAQLLAVLLRAVHP